MDSAVTICVRPGQVLVYVGDDLGFSHEPILVVVEPDRWTDRHRGQIAIVAVVVDLRDGSCFRQSFSVDDWRELV